MATVIKDKLFFNKKEKPQEPLLDVVKKESAAPPEDKSMEILSSYLFHLGQTLEQLLRDKPKGNVTATIMRDADGKMQSIQISNH